MTSAACPRVQKSVSKLAVLTLVERGEPAASRLRLPTATEATIATDEAFTTSH
jgi:hypothetical protein